MKKKLLVFMFRLAGGGAERTMLNIINNIDKEKFEVVLVLGTDNKNTYIDFVNPEVRIINLRCKRLRNSIFRLRKVILKEQPDVLFSTLNSNNIMLLAVKAISFSHLTAFVRETNNRTESGGVSLFNKLITSFLYNRYANKVISLSKGVKEDLIENFRIHENKIEVIYNPVEVNEIIRLSKAEVSDNIKINEEEKIVIASGRLVEQKDFHTLLQAFKIVSEKINTRLVILGKGPLLNELIEFSKKLCIDDRVVFLGFKKNPYKYLKLATVFVLSSRWEGFGHVVVEAMAAGLPVIATNCKSGPSEILEDNKYGLLVPVGNHKMLADKIIWLLNNPEQLDDFSEKGRIRAQDFDAKRIVLEYEELFWALNC